MQVRRGRHEFSSVRRHGNLLASGDRFVEGREALGGFAFLLAGLPIWLGWKS
jgi:hypothetical protein